MPSIKDAIEELERAYSMLVPRFDIEMPRPIITVQSAGRKTCLAWFSQKRWKSNTVRMDMCEINFSAEKLSRATVSICETLIHEMVHYANFIKGIKDCTQNQYHNARFKALAESVGLGVERMPNKGWASTYIRSDDLYTFIDEQVNLNPSAFDIFRVCEIKKEAPKNRLCKFTCGCTNVWAKTNVEARCERCDKAFEEAEGGAR